MQMSQSILPIIHPKRTVPTTRSWKHRHNKHGNKTKKVTQYGIVAIQ